MVLNSPPFPPRPVLRAIVFDFDGLVLDTESSCYASWRAVFRERGTDYALSEYQLIVGTHNGEPDPVRLLAARTGRTLDPGELETRRHAHERALNADLAPLPGVVPLLDGARAAAIRLAIASSSSIGWVEGHLIRLGLRDRFQAVVCRNETLRAKPEPDLYLEALRRLDVSAGEALALEDSHHGSIAARRAGLRCIAVPGPMTRTQDFAHVDRRLESLAEVDFAELAAWFARG
jgi:putative hydrolase of the HAD superfamily